MKIKHLILGGITAVLALVAWIVIHSFQSLKGLMYLAPTILAVIIVAGFIFEPKKTMEVLTFIFAGLKKIIKSTWQAILDVTEAPFVVGAWWFLVWVATYLVGGFILFWVAPATITLFTGMLPFWSFLLSLLGVVIFALLIVFGMGDRLKPSKTRLKAGFSLIGLVLVFCGIYHWRAQFEWFDPENGKAKFRLDATTNKPYIGTDRIKYSPSNGEPVIMEDDNKPENRKKLQAYAMEHPTPTKDSLMEPVEGVIDEVFTPAPTAVTVVERVEKKWVVDEKDTLGNWHKNLPVTNMIIDENTIEGDCNYGSKGIVHFSLNLTPENQFDGFGGENHYLVTKKGNCYSGNWRDNNRRWKNVPWKKCPDVVFRQVIN